jgi:tetratricopeptide (TPR) repeat protein
MISRRTKLLVIGLIASVALSVPASAEPAGVAALVNQGRYWQSKGRTDLANQAFRRVLAIDPQNATARQALTSAQPKPQAAQPKPQPPRKPDRPDLAAASRQARSRTPSPSVPAPADRGGDARAAGFKALDAGNLAAASDRFQSALQRNRNDADSLGGLGLVRLRQERFGEARELLQRASQRGNGAKWAEALSSSRFYAGIQEAQAAADAGRLDEGQRIAEELAASNFPKKQPAFGVLAGIYERQGRYADAARLYAQSTGSGATGHAIRAQALDAAASGNPALAEQLFQQGTMANPADPWIRYEFARFLESKGRRADADGIAGSLRNSNDPEALYAAALLSSQTSRPLDAEVLLDRIPASARTSEMRSLAFSLKTDAAIARAKALAAHGQTAQALIALRQLAGTPGLSVGSQGALAQALYDLGDQSGSAMVAQQALSSTGGSAQEMEPLIRVLAKTGQDAYAASAVQRAAQIGGDSPEGRRSVARLNGILACSQADRLREAGQYAAAFDVLQGQWNAAPGNLDVLSALARLYQSGGMYPQAAQTFQMVLNQSPSDVGALTGLVDSASAAGDFATAGAAAERAIAAAPSDYKVYLAAGRMEQGHGDQRVAKKYMERARALYLGQSGPATGGFTSANPFARSPVGGFASAQPVNPFALGSSPVSAPALGYAMAAPARDYPASNGMQEASPSDGQPARASSAMQAQDGITDPVLQSIDKDMRSLSMETGPRVEMATGYRERSGETGLSSLKELTGDAQISTDFAGGRVSAKASAVVLDSGQPTGSGLARFGRNPTVEAVGIVAEEPSDLTSAETQHASGVAVLVGYESKILKADVGSTPLGFPKKDVSAGITVTPRLSRYSTARIWAERRPVTDSIVAYAGTRDPVTGQFWGAVMKSGGGLSYSYDQDGSGIYGDISYYHYSGTNVRDNKGVQVNAGGYLRAYRDSSSTLTVGINANYQDYVNNQNFFTFGQGGYFSPQSFMSVSFPVRYAYRANALEIGASIVPGYQSYSQDGAPLFPTDTAAQATLDALKAQNSDVRARFDSISKTGFGISAGASAYYDIGDNTRIGGELNINTFGDYNEFRSLLGIKRQIGGQ